MIKNRFLKHYIINEIGKKGQENISKGKVLVVGAGGLGSPAITYLVSNGIGKIGVVDYDKVEISNLHRQILYYQEDVGKYKTLSVVDKIKKLNSNVEVDIYNLKLSDENGEDILKNYDFVIEATDNLKTKFLINDLTVKLKKPFSYAGINIFKGSTMTVIPGKSACLRCVFKNLNYDDREIGVFGTVPGIMGIVQAAEALKYIGGFGELLTNKMLIADILKMEFRTVDIPENDNCFCKQLK